MNLNQPIGNGKRCREPVVFGEVQRLFVYDPDTDELVQDQARLKTVPGTPRKRRGRQIYIDISI